ncbi:MAG: hypothetical protein HYZ42_05685 [Bacteroidetes bacterium]|nr:hypothetical protein [Bacteroidota bacterium]
MASIRATYKGKEINKDRKLPLQVTMCATVQDTFVLYCGQMVKDKIVWSRNGAKLEKIIDHGRVSYTMGIPSNCDVFNFERSCNFGADICACNDPFLYTNLNKENQVGLYTKGIFRSDMGIVVKTDTIESPILTLVDARSAENKVLYHAFENIGSTIAKENVIVNLKNKSGENFSGTIYFTRPVGENKEKYKLYILDESDSLNPVWQAINKPEEEKYTTPTCSTFSAQINKSGTYMFVGATGNFDHSVKIKVKKMQTPMFWILFKDKKKGLPGHVYHNGEGQGIYTVELSGEEKNTSLIVYAYKKGVKYYIG